MEGNFRPKSQEHLQAQAEAFGDKGVEEFSDEQKMLLKYSAELAKIEDLEDLPPDLSPELVELIESNRQRYVEFLRHEKKEEILFRKENAERYKETFQPAIKGLKEKMVTGHSKALPEYLGSGSNGDAYRIEVDGKEYAAKFSRITQANFEIKPLLRAAGIDHAAQLVAYSFEDSVVIMELLPGTDVSNFTPENAPEYDDEDIIQLIETVQKLDQNGIIIDPKPSNFLYDEEEGFSVLDFHLKGHYGSLADSVMSLRIALTARKWPRLDYRADDYEEKYAEQSIERSKIYLPMMVRFLTILRDKFPKILESYQRAYAERAADPQISEGPVVDRRYMQVDHPDLAPHLKKLEEMGF